jgi:uncharacterized protein YgiB involved in biofilm formation
MRKIASLLSLLAFAALGGCSDDAPVNQGPLDRGIFISSSDCAATEKLTLDQCGAVIDMAVATHQNAGPAYPALSACTAAEGPDHCSKDVDGRFRPRIAAFLITFGPQASATPLYNTADGAVGFKGIDNAVLGLEDASFTVSNAAQGVANQNARAFKG